MKLIKVDQVILDKFKIVERLGAGGQSFVYRAENLLAEPRPEWKKTVFIKQYTDLVPPDKEHKRIEAHFGNIKKKLKDATHLICLPDHLEVCPIHGSIMGVFPFVRGKKLSEKLNEGLHHEEKVRIAFALLNTIRKIHEQDIAHLDLKPDNIIVYNSKKDEKVYIQVIDLDGSKIEGIGLRANVIKTIGYGSPEHFASDGISLTSIKSDIFSLGIVLLELFVGNYPFDTHNLQSALNRDFSFGALQIHGDIIRTLISCLHSDSGKRPSAGKIQSVFHKYHDTKLLALSENDKWDVTKKGISVSLLLNNAVVPFKRTYFEDKIFTSQDLRGSKLKINSGEIFAFIFEWNCCYLTSLNKKINIKVEDYKLQEGVFYQLLSDQKIYIENDCLELKVTYF